MIGDRTHQESLQRRAELVACIEGAGPGVVRPAHLREFLTRILNTSNLLYSTRPSVSRRQLKGLSYIFVYFYLLYTRLPGAARLRALLSVSRKLTLYQCPKAFTRSDNPGVARFQHALLSVSRKLTLYQCLKPLTWSDCSNLNFYQRFRRAFESSCQKNSAFTNVYQRV